MIRLSRPTRTLTGCLAGALAVIAAPPLAAETPADQGDVEAETAPPAPSRGEQRLARLLEGRVAGQPVDCIRSLPSQRMQTIDGVAYVYGSGGTIWVQRTRTPAAIDDNDALVVTRFNGSQLCRHDIATTVDAVNGFFTGAVFFEEFVPYTRAKPAATSEG